MDGLVTGSPSRRLDILVDGPIAGLPRTGRLGWERAAQPFAIDPPRWRDRVAVLLATRDGAGWAELAGRREALRPGSILLFNSAEHRLRYGMAGGGTWEFCWADLTGAPALAAVRALVARHGHLQAGGDLLAAAIERHLPGRGARQAGWSAERAAQVAWEVLAAGAGERCHDAREDASLSARAMAWLEGHLALPAGVAAAAAALGLSREHFSRAFRRETGATPAAWLRRRRLELADRLLASGLDVAATARRAGFASRSHFALVYRRFRGRSPRR